MKQLLACAIFATATAMADWQHLPHHAQYKEADWSNLVCVKENMSAEQAQEFADADPNITFFFITTGGRMVLENMTTHTWRVFHHGDAAFFTGSPWWGSAPGLADGFVKSAPQSH